jgi:hypothetical protein
LTKSKLHSMSQILSNENTVPDDDNDQRMAHKHALSLK